MATVKRIVLFKFKDRTPEPKIEKFFSDLAGLQKTVPGINDFCWGPYSSSDNLNQGYTHGFVMTFKDAAARDGFGPHSEHQRVVSTHGENIASVLAFDFFT